MSEYTDGTIDGERDRTWPNPLPSSEQVRGVFFDTLSATAAPFPEGHLAHIKDFIFHNKPMERVTHDLHNLLTVRTEFNRAGLSGRNVVRGGGEFLPLVNRMGIDRHLDLAGGVLPALRPLLADVLWEDSDPLEKLNTFALTMGVVIEGAQSFSDGNTRIARTVHDYVEGGLENIDIARVADIDRNFTPPVAIEQLIMMQNLTQLIEHPDWPVLGEGVGEVTDKTVDTYLRAEEFLLNVWRLGDYDTSYEYRSPEAAVQRLALSERIRAVLTEDDEDLASIAGAILKQKKYAPAALAAAFPHRKFDRPLSTAEMRHLIDTNNDLMKMRTLSLGVGMARKGLFVAVDRPEDGIGPEITDRYWLPTNI